MKRFIISTAGKNLNTIKFKYMFGLFKLRKNTLSEIELVSAMLTALPEEYAIYLLQIKEGLINRIHHNASDIPNYHSFRFNGRNFKVSNIKVNDSASGQFMLYSLYFSYGVINGYSADSAPKKSTPNLKSIDTTDFKKSYFENPDYKKIEALLTEEEKRLINESDVYAVPLSGITLYTVQLLENGDFIGITTDNMAYIATHDPFELNEIDRPQLKNYLEQ